MRNERSDPQQDKPEIADTDASYLDSSCDALPGFEIETTAPLPSRKSDPKTRIENYTIKRVLGQGGMGTVYYADQTAPIKRPVALKGIKSGRDSRNVIARFDSERQAMALMNHTFIAKVLDAGLTQDNSPYFVMELIDGKSLIEFCDDQQLSIRQRLQLFVKVCRGIEHAHQKGIIHRDLKPSNILVTDTEQEPTPKIIDFGLAKAIEDSKPLANTNLTELGQVLGTVQYMSPEQAELGV